MKGYIGIDPTIYSDDEGFFKISDLGYFDEVRYFFIIDRLTKLSLVKTIK